MRRLLYFLILFVLFPIHSLYAISTQVNLHAWGLTRPQEIGFLYLSRLEDPPRMFIYDIRRVSPLFRTLTKPHSKKPLLQRGVFEVDSFEEPKPNSLGGFTETFAKESALSEISFLSERDYGLIFDYQKDSDSFAGLIVYLVNFSLPPEQRTYLDASSTSFLTFWIKGENENEEIDLGFVDYDLYLKQDSALVGPISSFLPSAHITKEWQQVWVPIKSVPTSIKLNQLASLVFQAKAPHQGRVFIRDLAFTASKNIISKKTPLHIPESSKQPNFAFWVWETSPILKRQKKSSDLVEFCKQNQVSDLFFQIPADFDSLLPQLKDLIHQLNSIQVKLHGLDGNPHFIEPQNREKAFSSLKKVIAYNQKNPKEKFYGFRYDNEPYLLEHFHNKHRQKTLKNYLSFIQEAKTLTHKAGLTLGMDLPFWFDNLNEFFEPPLSVHSKLFIERIIDFVDNLAIMDYRTHPFGAAGILESARVELQYAASKGKKVFVGLETSKIEDETLMQFTESGPHTDPNNCIRIYSVKEDLVQIELPPWSSKEAPDTQVLCALQVTPVSGNQISSYNHGQEALKKTIEDSLPYFSRFKSFAGFAIHSYESFQVLRK